MVHQCESYYITYRIAQWLYQILVFAKGKAFSAHNSGDKTPRGSDKNVEIQNNLA